MIMSIRSMKKRSRAVVAGLVVCAVAHGAFGQSPAEKSIDRAKQLIEKNGNDFEAYNALALAVSRRARELRRHPAKIQSSLRGLVKPQKLAMW